MTNSVKQQKKTEITATKEQIQNAYTIAQNRRVRKAAEIAESDAKESLLESIGDDMDVILVDEKGRVVVDTTHSVRTGNIDWDRFKKDHPGFDYDMYRKPSSSMVTVKPGPMIEAIAETSDLEKT